MDAFRNHQAAESRSWQLRGKDVAMEDRRPGSILAVLVAVTVSVLFWAMYVA